MPKLSNKQKEFLAEATRRYKRALPESPAAEYLESRNLMIPEARDFCLGYVADPLPGHEMYRGMLAIPYLRRTSGGDWLVVSMRFRCIEDHEHLNHGKYMSHPGDAPTLYNTLELVRQEDTIAICEGEIDAITATISGVPAVGVPGVKAWKDYFREPFLGYETVFVLADGDQPGLEFAKSVASVLPNARIVPFEPGQDVHSTYMEHGKEFIKERVFR